MSALNIQQLQFKYSSSAEFKLTIDHLSMNKGDHLFIDGPSGIGKTTLLNLITGLLTPTNGQIDILGTNIHRLSAIKRDAFRADHFGIIFQLFNLLPYLSVKDNILLPCAFSKQKKQHAMAMTGALDQTAIQLCNQLNLPTQALTTSVQELSIGQQQRVAIARALIGSPKIIIADEPTAALDNHNKQQFITTLLAECERSETTLIFVSHDETLKSHFNHHYQLTTSTKKDASHVLV